MYTFKDTFDATNSVCRFFLGGGGVFSGEAEYEQRLSYFFTQALPAPPFGELQVLVTEYERKLLLWLTWMRRSCISGSPSLPKPGPEKGKEGAFPPPSAGGGGWFSWAKRPDPTNISVPRLLRALEALGPCQIQTLDPNFGLLQLQVGT